MSIVKLRSVKLFLNISKSYKHLVKQTIYKYSPNFFAVNRAIVVDWHKVPYSVHNTGICPIGVSVIIRFIEFQFNILLNGCEIL